MTDRPIQWRVQDGSIIIGNNGLGTTVCYSASLHKVYRSLFIEVIAPLQPCSHYCLCILMLVIQLCFIKIPSLIIRKKVFLQVCFKKFISLLFYIGRFFWFWLPKIFIFFKIISLIFLIVSFFQLLPKKFFIFHLIVFFQAFLPPF